LLTYQNVVMKNVNFAELATDIWQRMDTSRTTLLFPATKKETVCIIWSVRVKVKLND